MGSERSAVGLIGLTFVLSSALAGCGPAAVRVTTQPTLAAATPTSAPTVVPATPEPTIPQPPPRARPSTDVPEGYRAARSADIGLGLVVGEVLMGWNMDTGEVYRWDAASLEALGTHQMGERGAFPPSAQSAAVGAGGVWINLASEHAVALMDPTTGKVVRRVEILGFPYDMVEVAGELWIADFEWSEVTRYDLDADRVVATIAVSHPTDIAFGEGAIWAPVHIGRASESEPITAGGQVLRIDPVTNAITTRANVGPRPYYIATGFGAAWTGTATGASVDRIDAATGEVTTIWVGEDGAFDIEVVGDSVWAIPGQQWPPERRCDPKTSFFVRIDPTTRTVRERVAFPCPGSITPDGDGFWVAGSDADGPVTRFFEPIGT